MKLKTKDIAIIATGSGLVLGALGVVAYQWLRPRFDERRRHRELVNHMTKLQQLVAEGRVDSESIAEVVHEIDALKGAVKELKDLKELQEEES